MPASSRCRSASRRSDLAARCCLLLAALASLGCEPPVERDAAAQADPLPTPEERFESIVTTLKRQLENEKLSGLNAKTQYNSPPGSPITNAKVRVLHELIPPESEGEPYRGVVSLSTKSTVTVVLAEPSGEEAADSAAKRKAKLAELETDLEGVADLDTLMSPSASRAAASPIHEIKPDETASRFELEYRDGLWRLVSELDRENEPFYAVAIEYALKRQ